MKAKFIKKPTNTSENKLNLRTPKGIKGANHKRKLKRDQRLKKKADYLATLPKSRLKRLAFRMHPKRVARFVFSREGLVFILIGTGVAAMLAILTVVLVFTYYRRELPPDINGELAKVKQTTKFYDRTGSTLLFEAYGDENRTIIPFEEMSYNIKKATIALEDRNFYEHNGFDAKGVARAAVTNITGGSTQQGGSTLTQQFIKNLLFADETRYSRSYTRKIKELILSIELENKYSKDQILAFYLNQIPYGPTEYGVQAASRSYFNKDAKDLTIDEAAMLASIPQQPPAYNPYKEANRERLRSKMNRVMDLMAEQGYIKSEEAKAAKEVDTFAKLVPLEQKGKYRGVGLKVGHFIDEVQEELVRELGKSVVYEGGLKVITTIDLRLQDLAIDSVNKSIKLIEAQGNNVNIVAIDNQTGQVLAYLGSRDYSYPGFGNFDTLQDKIQPGSSIKPFDYAELMKDRPGADYGPGTIIKDEPINIGGYKPVNSSGGFWGAITMRTALATSRNTTAVKAAYIAGMENVINLARESGNKNYCLGQDCGLSASMVEEP